MKIIVFSIARTDAPIPSQKIVAVVVVDKSNWKIHSHFLISKNSINFISIIVQKLSTLFLAKLARTSFVKGFHFRNG